MKKALVVESEGEGDSDGEVDMKSMMKTLALITKEYNRGYRRPGYRGKFEREDKGRGMRRDQIEKTEWRRRIEKIARRVFRRMMEEMMAKVRDLKGASNVANLATLLQNGILGVQNLSRRRMQIITR